MPGFDRTGPRGFGPRTGRCMGPCGCRYRRGFRRRSYGAPRPLTKKEEKEMLEEEKKAIQEDLKSLEERLKELE